MQVLKGSLFNIRPTVVGEGNRKRQIQIPLDKAVKQLVIGIAGHLDIHALCIGLEPLERLLYGRGDDMPLLYAHVQPHVHPLCSVVDDGAQGAVGLLDQGVVVQKSLPRPGQSDIPTAADKQEGLKLLLQLGDAVAQGGLGNVKTLRRLAEIQCFSDFVKVAIFLVVQGCSSSLAIKYNIIKEKAG